MNTRSPSDEILLRCAFFSVVFVVPAIGRDIAGRQKTGLLVTLPRSVVAEART